MDRLSAYAARESESDSPEQRKIAEVDATTKLLEKLKVSKESKPAEDAETTKQNGEGADGEQAEEADSTPAEPAADESDKTEDVPRTNGDHKKARGIPDNVRLFEVFHEQVMNLVGMQRLPIQDIIPLLVSLVNLAL